MCWTTRSTNQRGWFTEMETEIREGGRILESSFFPSSRRVSAKTRDSKNPSAPVPHFDAVRSIIAIDHAEGKCRGRLHGGRSCWNHAGDFASRDENVRTPILSRLAMILKRHLGSDSSLGILRDKFIKFWICIDPHFFPLPVTFRSPFHSFCFPVIGFLWFSLPFFLLEKSFCGRLRALLFVALGIFWNGISICTDKIEVDCESILG